MNSLTRALTGLIASLPICVSCGAEGPAEPPPPGATGTVGSAATTPTAGTTGVGTTSGVGTTGGVGTSSSSGGASTTPTGGTTTTGGAAGAGSQAGSSNQAGNPSGGSDEPGGDAGSEPDCNAVGGQPIVTVAPDGSGDHKTVKAAVDAVGKGNTTPTQIRIKPGTYKEKFTIETPLITLCGEAGKAASTVITGNATGTSTGFTVLVTANDVSIENITIQNTDSSTQAPALMTKSQRTQFRNCRILGFQDTLYAHTGTQYFRNCYIEGRVDYIFGGATAVFQSCEMRTVAAGSAICAPNTSPSVPFGIVFFGGKTTATSNIAKGSQNLARSWGKEGATHYIGTELGEHINPNGWASMKAENKVSDARFGEYGTTGPGANPSARSSEVKVMTAADAAKFTVQNIFGSWTPSFSK